MKVRWQATVFYRVENGPPVEVVHDLEELGDIEGLVEAGPHWDTIAQIIIHRVNHIDGKTLTVEEAAKL